MWEENEQRKYGRKVSRLGAFLRKLKIQVYVLAVRLGVGRLFGIRSFKNPEDLIYYLENND